MSLFLWSQELPIYEQVVLASELGPSGIQVSKYQFFFFLVAGLTLPTSSFSPYALGELDCLRYVLHIVSYNNCGYMLQFFFGVLYMQWKFNL